MWVSVEASEEWIAELQGGKGGMQDNWGGAKASANVYAGAEGPGGDNVIEGFCKSRFSSNRFTSNRRV